MGISNSEILRWATDAHASSLGLPPQNGASSNHLQQHSPMAIDEELPLDLSLAGRASVGAVGAGVQKTGQPKRPKKIGRANSQGGVGAASQFQPLQQPQQQQGIPLPSSMFSSPPTSQQQSQHTGRGVNRSASSVSSFSPTHCGSDEPDPMDHFQQSLYPGLSRARWASRSGHQAPQRHYPQYRSVRIPHSQRKQLYYQPPAGVSNGSNGTAATQQGPNGVVCSPVLSGQAVGKEKELGRWLGLLFDLTL